MASTSAVRKDDDQLLQAIATPRAPALTGQVITFRLINIDEIGKVPPKDWRKSDL
jgi:hypothetical protein